MMKNQRHTLYRSASAKLKPKKKEKSLFIRKNSISIMRPLKLKISWYIISSHFQYDARYNSRSSLHTCPEFPSTSILEFRLYLDSSVLYKDNQIGQCRLSPSCSNQNSVITQFLYLLMLPVWLSLGYLDWDCKSGWFRRLRKVHGS